MWDSYGKNIINTFNDLISLAEKTSTVSKWKEIYLNISNYVFAIDILDYMFAI